MSVTRYYPTVGSGTTPPLPTVPYSASWERVPAAGSADNDSRRMLANVKVATTVLGRTATKPTSLPGGTVAFQLRTPPLPARNIVGSFRLAWGVGYIGNYSFRANVLLCSAAGVVKAVLADASTATLPSGSGPFVRLITSALTEAAADAGDFIVFELGFDIVSGLGGSATATGFQPTGGVPPPDLPYVAGGSTSASTGAPWIELTLLDPPAQVTGLELTTVGTDTFTVEWDDMPDADGYVVYVDGSLAADYLGPPPTLTHTALGLAPATDYFVQVYAYGPGGVGEPAELLVTTIDVPAGYYRATVVVGPHTWTAERTEAPQLGPLLPLDLGWELPDDAPGIPAQPNPDTCTLSILTAAALADVATGTPARVTVWLDPSPGGRPFATMAGEVGDLEVFPRQLPDGSHGVLSRMLLVGHETHPNAYRVGSQPWPAESGAARAARIMAEAGQLPWSTPIPVGNNFAERPARETPKGDALTQALTEAAVYVAGDYSPPARHLWHATADEAGNLEGFTAELVAAETTAIDVLDGAWVNRAASWRRTRRRDGAWVQVTHPGGVTIYGRPGGPPMPPVTLEVTDPDPYADLLLSSLYADAWLSGEWFRVHLHAEDCPLYGLEWFRRDDLSPGFPAASRAVVVDNIQVVPGLFTRYGGMLAGARLVIEPGGRVMLLFRLRPDVPAWSVVTPRWMDEDPAATWADEPPAATWAELRTTPREDD